MRTPLLHFDSSDVHGEKDKEDCSVKDDGR